MHVLAYMMIISYSQPQLGPAWFGWHFSHWLLHALGCLLSCCWVGCAYLGPTDSQSLWLTLDECTGSTNNSLSLLIKPKSFGLPRLQKQLHKRKGGTITTLLHNHPRSFTYRLWINSIHMHSLHLQFVPLLAVNHTSDKIDTAHQTSTESQNHY